MREKLCSHLEEKIKGDIWHNEIRSRLARPLSATTFCDREEQLQHRLSAPQFAPTACRQRLASPAPAPATSTARATQPATLFPFSVEVHACARQIGRCYAAMRFRAGVLARVRLVATATRVFRRGLIPRFVQWHRGRKAAATRIQKRYRGRLRWRAAVVRPQVEPLVVSWVLEGLWRARSKIVIVVNLERLFIARKERIHEARRRRLVLARWCAKTKVCLFVHMVWCVQWFRKKRESNIQVMRHEAEAMEAITAQKAAELHILFKTSMGTKLLKKELSAWRQRVRLASAPPTGASLASALPGSLPTGSAPPAIDGAEFVASVVRLRSCFNAFDMDSSGALDLDEFQLMISYLRDYGTAKRSRSRESAGAKLAKRAKLSPAQIRGLFDDLDEDGSGRVTRDEFERWWSKQHELPARAASSSASASFLSGGLDKLVLESHGLLFWLLGKKQQLERKFVKKLMTKAAADAEKLSFLAERMQSEASSPARRCAKCGRRFELLRDRNEHEKLGCSAAQLVVDTFVLKKWVREEEIRLLEDEA
ncbi:hypothetical protein PybrP1_011417 [[Pythium] brassicae (nom. inval.)]|nr:hypothetical protein PybrP1_011417 [[Pythium] brassicae (nom. inval.)]